RLLTVRPRHTHPPYAPRVRCQPWVLMYIPVSGLAAARCVATRMPQALVQAAAKTGEIGTARVQRAPRAAGDLGGKGHTVLHINTSEHSCCAPPGHLPYQKERLPACKTRPA